MNSNEHDDLWDLLGKAKQISPSPFLARNVLREIRAQQSRPSSSLAGRAWAMVRKWRLAATICATAIALFALNSTRFEPRSNEPEAIQLATTNPDYEVIANLDELLASQENSLWTDPSLE